MEEGYFGFLFGRRKYRLMRLRETSDWDIVWSVLVREIYVLLVSGCVQEEWDLNTFEASLRCWKRGQPISATLGSGRSFSWMRKEEDPSSPSVHPPSSSFLAEDLLYHAEMSLLNVWSCRAIVVDKDPVQAGAADRRTTIMRFVWDWDGQVLLQEQWKPSPDGTTTWRKRVLHELTLDEIRALPPNDMPRLSYDQILARTCDRYDEYVAACTALQTAEQETRQSLAHFRALHATAYIRSADDRLRALALERASLIRARRMIFHRFLDLNLLEEEDDEPEKKEAEEAEEAEETEEAEANPRDTNFPQKKTDE